LQVFTAVAMKNVIFWEIVSSTLVKDRFLLNYNKLSLRSPTLVNNIKLVNEKVIQESIIINKERLLFCYIYHIRIF
jgi:hypothetical protein